MFHQMKLLSKMREEMFVYEVTCVIKFVPPLFLYSSDHMMNLLNEMLDLTPRDLNS